jgi:cell division septation protein DedD
MTATESQTEVQPAAEPEPQPALEIPEALPLQPEDPPRVGEFWLRGRLGANAAGYLYAASTDDGRDAIVAMMTEGSADDAAARERFVNAVDDLPETAVLAHNDSDDDDLALWAAIGPIRTSDGTSAASDERLIAERRGEDILSAVLMDRVPQPGKLRGPDFRHYWENRRRPGLFRIWPLPWPNALRPASRWALALALLTMAVIMALAVFLAWLLFRHAQPMEPEPVIPTPTNTATVTITPTTPPPGTGSPSSGPTTTVTPTTGVPTRVPSGTPTGTSTDPGSKF